MGNDLYRATQVITTALTTLFEAADVDACANLMGRIAVEAALNSRLLDGAEKLLGSEEYQEQVWSQVEAAYQAGVTGVPYFRIDGGGHGKELSGGQRSLIALSLVLSLLKFKPAPIYILDEVDAAARILDPVLGGHEPPLHGVFLKDYAPCEW